MRVIGFDAAKHRTGWAFETLPRVWMTGVLKPSDTKSLGDVVRRAVDAGCETAAIEDCYLARGNMRNVVVLKALQDAQTRIRVACELAGLRVVLIYAHVWQSAYGLRGPRDDRKLGAQRVANMLGAGALTQDEADAVCLADYAYRHGQQEELRLCGPRGGKWRG